MVCEAVDLCLNSIKIPKDLEQGVQNVSCAILEEEDINENMIVSNLNAVSTFEHVKPKQMAEEQQKDSTLELVYQLVTAGEKPKTLAIAKIKSKAVRKYLLQFDRLTLKKGVLHQLYIHNDVQFPQMVLLIKFQAQVLQLLHDGQGHQGIERTIALCQELILLEYHVPGCNQICKRVSMMSNCEGRLHRAKYSTGCYNSK